MFKFIFDLVTDPLGLPIEWYYEWIILTIIGYVAYLIAYDKVGKLYRSQGMGYTRMRRSIQSCKVRDSQLGSRLLIYQPEI